MNKQMQFTHALCVFGVKCSLRLGAHGMGRFSLRDSLVGLYFEVSPFLKLMSIFVPAKRRTGTPRRLALQVQLVPFDQRLASHQPELRSRSWTERERKETIRATPVTLPIMPGCFRGCAHSGETAENLCAQVKVLKRSRVESILISSQAYLNDAFYYL